MRGVRGDRSFAARGRSEAAVGGLRPRARLLLSPAQRVSFAPARRQARIPGRGVNPNLTSIHQNGERRVEENPRAGLATCRGRAGRLGLWLGWLLARGVGESSTALRLEASPPPSRGKAPRAAFPPPPSISSGSNVRLPRVSGAYRHSPQRGAREELFLAAATHVPPSAAGRLLLPDGRGGNPRGGMANARTRTKQENAIPHSAP